jgi:hypothetical protein
LDPAQPAFVLFYDELEGALDRRQRRLKLVRDDAEQLGPGVLDLLLAGGVSQDGDEAERLTAIARTGAE